MLPICANSAVFFVKLWLIQYNSSKYHTLYYINVAKCSFVDSYCSLNVHYKINSESVWKQESIDGVTFQLAAALRFCPT